MTKTEDQVEKDKEAVTKMIGTKSAMEAVLRHVDNLEDTIKKMRSAHNDCMKAVGDGVIVRAYRNTDGTPRPDQQSIYVSAISDWINQIAEKSTR